MAAGMCRLILAKCDDIWHSWWVTAFGETVSAAEAADMLEVDRSTVIRWIGFGDLRGVKTPGGRWRVFEASIDELLARFKAS